MPLQGGEMAISSHDANTLASATIDQVTLG